MIDKRSDEGVEWYAAWMDCWEMICKAFPNAKPEDGTGDVYADRLCDLSPALLRAAVEQVLCTHEYGNWLPTIAAIRIAARGLTDPVSTSSLEVWGATMAEIAASMTERRPMKLEPDVRKLVDALGGRKLILDEPKPAIIRAQFLKAYERNMAEAERVRTMTPIARQYVPDLAALTDGADA